MNSPYYTADICDAYATEIKIADAIGFKDFGGRKLFSGQIVTIKCFEDHDWVHKAVEMDGTGKVLIIDSGGSMHCAIVGDKISGLAVKNNWNGIIVFGSIRDSEGIGKLDLGLKALNTYPLTKVSTTVWEENIPVSFAGITFFPGEYVYADMDGIVVSAKEISL